MMKAEKILAMAALVASPINLALMTIEISKIVLVLGTIVTAYFMAASCFFGFGCDFPEEFFLLVIALMGTAAVGGFGVVAL